MRFALLAALVLATPLVAATSFVAPAPALGVGTACGEAACFALAPDDAVVRVEGGSGLLFLAADGTPLAGAPCAAGPIRVPPGAALLRVTPGAC